MKNSFRNICISIIAVVFSSSVAAGQTKKLSGPLDGKKFTLLLVQDEKKEIPDELSFTGGKCKTTYFTGKDWMFAATPYEITFVDSADVHKKKYDFIWETTNKSNEKITFNGSIDGEEIEGTAETTSKRGKKLKSYTFTGTLKSKKGAKAK